MTKEDSIMKQFDRVLELLGTTGKSIQFVEAAESLETLLHFSIDKQYKKDVVKEEAAITIEDFWIERTALAKWRALVKLAHRAEYLPKELKR